ACSFSAHRQRGADGAAPSKRGARASLPFPERWAAPQGERSVCCYPKTFPLTLNRHQPLAVHLLRHWCGPCGGASPTAKKPAGGVPALARQKARAAAAWVCTDCSAAAALECGTPTVQQPKPRLPELSVASVMIRYTRPSPPPWRSARNCSEPTSISTASGELFPSPLPSSSSSAKTLTVTGSSPHPCPTPP